MTLKDQICEALYRWINQRPSLEPGNYISGWQDSAGRAAYRSESRRITRQGHDARRLLREVELHESITAEDILAACRAYSGRLTIKAEPQYATAETCPGRPCGDCCDHRTGFKVAISYCTGQYWPTEYRAAACAVLSQALWDWRRDKAMPQPVRVANGDGLSAGDWLRRSFRRDFGRSMQARWFD